MALALAAYALLAARDRQVVPLLRILARIAPALALGILPAPLWPGGAPVVTTVLGVAAYLATGLALRAFLPQLILELRPLLALGR